jgi:hypothetical protein
VSPRDLWTPGTRERPYAEVEPHPTRDFVTPDGRRFVDSSITISLEQAERMWQGYLCARCLEPFEEAYPEKCEVCRFPVRELQRKLLERDFLGHDPTVVSGFPLDRELEYLERVKEK